MTTHSLDKASVAKLKNVIDRFARYLTDLNIDNRKLRSFAGLPVMTHAFFTGSNGLYEGIDTTGVPIGGTVILGFQFRAGQ